MSTHWAWDEDREVWRVDDVLVTASAIGGEHEVRVLLSVPLRHRWWTRQWSHPMAHHPPGDRGGTEWDCYRLAIPGAFHPVLRQLQIRDVRIHTGGIPEINNIHTRTRSIILINKGIVWYILIRLTEHAGNPPSQTMVFNFNSDKKDRLMDVGCPLLNSPSSTWQKLGGGTSLLNCDIGNQLREVAVGGTRVQ